MPNRLLAILAACLLGAGAAHATVVSGAFTGTIAGNTRDTYGLFGAVGADLSGDTFVASYRYDTGQALSYVLQPTSDAYLGTGMLTLQITIAGTTVSTAGVLDSEVADTQDGAGTMVTLANSAPTPLLDFTLFVTEAWVPGVTIDAPFVLDTGDYGQTVYVSADGSHYDALNFVGASLPAAVPEPGPLALLATALIGLGCARRRRTGRSAA